MLNLSLEKRGPVALLRFRGNGAGNELDGALIRALLNASETVANDDDARVAVLTAEGEAFSHGWDWRSLAGEHPSGIGLLQAARLHGLLGDPFGCLASLRKPVVCAINGDTLSAGLALALACDIRVAAEDAGLGLPEASLGLLPMAGATQRLARLVGRGKALEMLLTGGPVSAAHALAIGLVNGIARRNRVLDDALAIAGLIAERGPLAVQYAKEAVSRGTEMPLEQALRFETDLTVILQTTEDRAEGVSAFMEKRKPKFKGK